jgi:hypothetical protein
MATDITETIEGQRQERLNTISNLVATEIGGTATDARVKDIIQASNARGILFHGIRNNSKAVLAATEGIKPLTPESTYDGPPGMTSFWSTGENLFGGLKSNGGLETFDTTFFHWSHASDGEAHLNIAVTDKEEINKISPVMIKQNSTVEIPFTVPPKHLTLLRVKVDPADMDQGARYAYRKAEERMLGLLEKVVDGEYKVGEIIELKPEKVSA